MECFAKTLRQRAWAFVYKPLGERSIPPAPNDKQLCFPPKSAVNTAPPSSSPLWTANRVAVGQDRGLHG